MRHEAKSGNRSRSIAMAVGASVRTTGLRTSARVNALTASQLSGTKCAPCGHAQSGARRSSAIGRADRRSRSNLRHAAFSKLVTARGIAASRAASPDALRGSAPARSTAGQEWKLPLPCGSTSFRGAWNSGKFIRRRSPRARARIASKSPLHTRRLKGSSGRANPPWSISRNDEIASAVLAHPNPLN